VKLRRSPDTKVSPTPEPPSQDIAPEVLAVGLRDKTLSGWDQASSNELFPGFTAGPGDTVIDVGCGDSPHSAFFAKSGADIILADLLPESATAAADRLRALGGTNVRELVTDSNPIPLADSSVNRVIATEVVEHVPDPAQFLSELVRIGTSDAVFLISAPHRASEELVASFAAPGYFEPPNHVRIFGDGELETAVEAAGLTIVRNEVEGFYRTLWWCFFWASAQPQIGPPYQPLLQNWMATWQELLDTPQGEAMKQELDKVLPKCRVVVATKP
jgi:SAM-dependent methyltransferase